MTGIDGITTCFDYLYGTEGVPGSGMVPLDGTDSLRRVNIACLRRESVPRSAVNLVAWTLHAESPRSVE
jgi:hypothetical protein